MTFRTVLIVDSDHNSRVTLRYIFEEEGHYVISSTSGAEAFLLLEKVSIPSIILVATDVVMSSGESFLVRFHATEIYAKVPAIQIKRTNFEENLDGVCGELIPPFAKDTVLEVLKHCE